MAAGVALDCWMQPEGGPLLVAARQPATALRQRMQGRLPVVATAFEARTLRLATEAWVCTVEQRPGAALWVAVQAVVFNLSDDAARGHFYFALGPWGVGSAPVRHIAYRDGAFVANGRLAAVYLPRPVAWDCAAGALDDVAAGLPALAGRDAAADRAGACVGLAAYRYHIAPWEEAEFLAFLPLDVGRRATAGWRVGPALPATPGPSSYALLKGAGTRAWRTQLNAGMSLRLPDARLEESWAVNVGHLLVGYAAALRGPVLVTETALILAALAGSGYGAAAWPALVELAYRQAPDGSFGGAAETGAALWTLNWADRLAPNWAVLAGLWLRVALAANWLQGLPVAPSAHTEWAQVGLSAAAAISARLGLTGPVPADPVPNAPCLGSGVDGGSGWADRSEGAIIRATTSGGDKVPVVRRMHAAQRLLRSGAGGAGELVRALLNEAPPTYAWAGPDGAHSALATAHWLMLLRDLVLFEDGNRLVLLGGLPSVWLASAGTVEAVRAPTAFGVVSVQATWTAGGALRIDISADQEPPGGYELRLPCPVISANRDGAPLAAAAFTQDTADAFRIAVPRGTRSVEGRLDLPR